MIQVMPKWGALYLVFDEPLNLTKEPIKSNGFTINVGDKITQIGKIRRTMFVLKDGLYMEYQGTMKHGESKLAIFHCPVHTESIGTLFSKPVNYRYCFYMVEVKDEFVCFMSGVKSGMYDIWMNDLKFFKQ